MSRRKAFFDSVREDFGPLKQHQVEGFERVLDYAVEHRYPKCWVAYILASIWHETSGWMQPIREGGIRKGPATTDAQARRAVDALFNKGIIRRNYALPDANGNSFYGRGLLQITHKSNYLKFERLLGIPLSTEPDLALDWDVSLEITFTGMRDGLFTGKSLDLLDPQDPDYRSARPVVNGDIRRNGSKIAAQARNFEKALELFY